MGQRRQDDVARLGDNSGKHLLLFRRLGLVDPLDPQRPAAVAASRYAADMPGLGDSDPPDDVRDVWSVTHCVETATDAICRRQALRHNRLLVRRHGRRPRRPWSSRIRRHHPGRAGGLRRPASRARSCASSSPRCRPAARCRGAAQSRARDAARPGNVDGVAIYMQILNTTRAKTRSRDMGIAGALRRAAALNTPLTGIWGEVRFLHLSLHPGAHRSVPCVAAGLRDERHSRVRGTGLPTRRRRRSIRS